ncbi:ferredoxin [Allobranchiibius sp. CTAmp26]|uniref:ferredoxin n=1 Tax=Allobranchiibius sp. CTAmp26 TaxID=2815214 RepID=UPI001AA16DC9|nr:ferredoxin [Allobranchiibius sp. CTAmp26]MBO1755039.1 ferredoxin [Allobranchiibius sp. CTAmp26]
MRRDKRGEDEVVVDRVACTAHGVCSVVSNGAIELDEFGYPVPSRLTMGRRDARELVAQCPARALLIARDR